MFEPGDKVEIVEAGTTFIRTGSVRIKRLVNTSTELEVEITSPGKGAVVPFCFIRGHGWKTMYRSVDETSLEVNLRGPSYVIRKVS